MFLSVSRRTDIPAFYTPWLINRFREGFVLVRNPMSFHQVSKVILSEDVIDGIVFWTKNAEPIIGHLDVFKAYPYYFQFTVNSYGTDIEPGTPTKQGEVIPTFQRLSDKISPERVIWRYDPILINDKYTKEYHYEYFEKMAKKLHGYTRKCTISFIDMYRSILKNVRILNLKEITDAGMLEMGRMLSQIAAAYDLKLETCAEQVDLSSVGIEHGCCVDPKLFEEISGYQFKAKKDPNQRTECHCAASIDIGLYNTCAHGCLYCYANASPKSAYQNREKHDPNSALLVGEIHENDIIKERKMVSLKEAQMKLFT